MGQYYYFPIFPMGKEGHREVKPLPQGHTAGKHCSKTCTQILEHQHVRL